MLASCIANAHKVYPMCWNLGQYYFNATGVATGTATVKVYSNSGYTNLIYSTTLNVTSSQINYHVNQPVRTTVVYVLVTWSDKKVSKNTTGTNQCITTPITFGNIMAKNIGGDVIITFQAESDDDNNSVKFNITMSDNTIKEFNIPFKDKLLIKDIWVVIINVNSKLYKIKKNNQYVQ